MKMDSMRLTLLAGLVALLVAAPDLDAQRRSVADAPAFVEAADAWVKDAIERVGTIPGLAVVVVVDDEVVLSRGYGMADREKGIASSNDAVYYIASSTKSFTGLVAAMLEAEGKVELGSSLASNAEGVKFSADVRAGQVTLRELLTHTSGVSNDGIAFRLAVTGQHDPETLWDLLPLSTPNRGALRGSFDYTNTGYNILGMILDRKLGKPWQDLLQDRIFEPLGMKRTTAYASKPRKKGWPLAVPYSASHPDGMRRSYLVKHDDTMQSAGGMMTTADDLGRWLEFQINQGKVDGKQLISPEIVRATHARMVDVNWDHSMFGMESYGLGWFHGRLHDEPVIHHAGGFSGFRTQVSFMPQKRVGVAVLTNASSRITEVASIWAYEWWLNMAPKDWTAARRLDELVQTRTRVQKRVAGDLAKRAERKSQLARPLTVYTGEYQNASMGTIQIHEADGHLRLVHGRTHCVIAPYTRPETGRLELVPGRGEVIGFQPETGRVASVSIGGTVFAKRSRKQDTGTPTKESADRTAIIRAGLDYVEALYEVKPEFIKRSVHPSLTKLGFYRETKDEAYELSKMNYESLLALAGRWNRSGKRAGPKSLKKVEVLDVMDTTAVLKVSAVWGVDHMQLGKFDGKWQVVHILWQSHMIK